jgi:hypothetical protein
LEKHGRAVVVVLAVEAYQYGLIVSAKLKDIDPQARLA